MSNIYIPAESPDDWQRFLADPEKQWRTGFSAKTTAHSWQSADGFPPEVAALLSSSARDAFHGVEFLLALPEHKVSLPPSQGHPSQNDVFVLAKASDGNLISIAVEAKVSEPFDKTVAEWISKPTPGKIERLDFLRSKLGLINSEIGNIRYQLFHRLASAIIEAERFGARYAVMVIHSFSQRDEWFNDFANFVSLFGESSAVGNLVHLTEMNGISVHAGWARGDKAFLKK